MSKGVPPEATVTPPGENSARAGREPNRRVTHAHTTSDCATGGGAFSCSIGGRSDGGTFGGRIVVNGEVDGSSLEFDFDTPDWHHTGQINGNSMSGTARPGARRERPAVTESITKTQRWLDLLAYLIGRRFPVSVEQIMEAVPAYADDWREGDETARRSVRRKFERDKDELRDLGIPLETVPYSVEGEPQEGYSLARRDFYLPYLRIVGAVRPGEERPAGPAPGASARPPQSGAGALELSASDAGAALDALWRAEALPHYPYAAEARSAFHKLSGDFDLESFRRPRVLHLDRPNAEDIGPALRELAEALGARKRVCFEYHGIHRDEATERDVAPYGLVFQGGHWYLVGHDALRDDVRVLRVSRMRDLSRNRAAPHTPDYEIPEDFRLDDTLGREAWELGSAGEGEVTARVRFRFPLSLWAARNGHGELVETEDDGASVRRFAVRQLHPFLRWVISFEGEAEILAPAELRAGARDMAAEVARRHERPVDDDADPGPGSTRRSGGS